MKRVFYDLPHAQISKGCSRLSLSFPFFICHPAVFLNCHGSVVFQKVSLNPTYTKAKVTINLNFFLVSHFFRNFVAKYSLMVKIKVVNTGHQPLPAYATADSAGLDLRANIDEDIVLHPMERKLVPTGLHIALPKGYEAQIRPRSGLALKHGITVLNSPGTVDADYRGEIMTCLINLSNEDFIIKDGERIAQMIIAQYSKVDFESVDVLDETERGEGGYGHTGVK